jgi:hypothetical protein
MRRTTTITLGIMKMWSVARGVTPKVWRAR